MGTNLPHPLTTTTVTATWPFPLPPSFQPSPNLGRRASKTNPAPPPLLATASVNYSPPHATVTRLLP